MTGLNEVYNADVEGKMKLFKMVWDEIGVVIKQNPQALEISHFKIKTKLKYYLNPAFLQGAIIRINSLIGSGKLAEASHYLNGILIDMVENYAWLKASIKKVKMDYTTLMRSLESLEKENPKNYEHIIKFLNLSDINKSEAAKTIEETRKATLKIREERKVLIKNHLLKS
jgi:hypothetical protein